MLPALLLENWKSIAIGIAALLLGGYIVILKGQVHYYQSKSAEYKLALQEALDREKQLEILNSNITNKYKDEVQKNTVNSDRINDLVQKEIKQNEELNKLRVSLRAARLFNESKRDPAAPVTKAVEGDAGSTNSTETGATPQTEGFTVSLADIFSVSAENDKNHWKCVKQVEAWQHFWHDYELAYQAVIPK